MTRYGVARTLVLLAWLLCPADTMVDLDFDLLDRRLKSRFAEARARK